MATAVIPCGGRGTRMAAVAGATAKELLAVAGKPLLQWTLEEAAAAGLTRAVVVTSPEKRSALATMLTARPTDRVTATVVVQPEPRGLGDAIACARTAVGGAGVAVMLPDNLFERGPAIGPVLEAARRAGAAAVLLARIGAADAALKGATGRVRTGPRPDGLLAVQDLAPKGPKGARFDPGPGAAAFTAIGRMVFGPDLFDALETARAALPPGAELDDVPVLQALARAGRLIGVPLESEFYDVGIPEGYAAALARFG